MAYTLNIEVDREEDGRWIAEVVDIAGVMAYGDSREEAISKAEAIALRVIADDLEERKTPAEGGLSFVAGG